MERMKLYPSYKASYLPDMGSIPAHWGEQRMKHSFVEVDERSITGDEEMLSVSHITGVTPRSQKNVNMFVAETNIGQKLCRPGYIAINTMWAWMAAMGVSEYEGIVSPSYGVYKPINETYNPNYLDYLLRTEVYQAEYNRRSTGVNSSRLRLYPDRFLDMRFVCPLRNEQDQIVRFLDWKVSQINRIINAKKKQIALLQEHKRAVVNEAVMRDAWSTRRLKTFLTESKDTVGDKSAEFDLLSLTKGGVIIRDVSTGKGKFPSDFGTYKVVRAGQIIFCLFDVDETPRTVGLSKNDGMITGAYDVFSISDIEPKFLEYYFIAIDDVKGLKPLYSGLRKVVNIDKFLQIQVPIPPITEQQSIVVQLDSQCVGVNKLIEKINTQIALLHEYRTRLISDVVTGKMDVRGVEVPQYEEMTEFTEDIEESDEDVEKTEEDSC
ncbi:restriction endonuclease subunit S [Paenibacillus solani]|uniref:restriction endonuclease subunit S n=1 Tax=Paenibacillus solani TaxID=1705565 RepID=UPI003D2654B1